MDGRRLHLSPDAYRRITLLALVALCVIIVTGAAVRLTGSGLGCSDWPNCEEGQFVAERDYHAWVEFGNRLFTGVVSVAVILAVLGSLLRVPRRRDLTRWSLGLVAGVLAQIVLGAIVVKTELVPAAVSAHFLVSIVLVWNAVVLHVKAGEPETPAQWVVSPAVRWHTRVVVGLLAVVLFLGTIVTSTGPHRGDPDVKPLSFDIGQVTRVHSSAVWLLVLTTVALIVSLHRTAAPVAVRRWAWILAGLLVVQGGIGYAQYFNGVPVRLVAAHVLGSVLVWIAALRVALAERVHPEPAADHVADPDPAAEATAVPAPV